MKGALGEMLAACSQRFEDLKTEPLLRGLLAREATMTTYLGLGVSLPHVRAKLGRRYILALGRSRAGIDHDGTDGERSHIVIMLLADEKSRDYLQVLAAIARLVKEPELVQSLVESDSVDMLYDRLIAGLGGMQVRRVPQKQNRMNRLMIREADRVAKGAECDAILVMGDVFIGGIDTSMWTPKIKSILVTKSGADGTSAFDAFAEVIQVRSFSPQRLAQVRSAILVALTRGIISFTDRLCCIGGVQGSNQFDTVGVVDVEREFQTLLTGNADLLPDDVKPEVFERVIAVATELGVEGREGKPVGCLFVVGASAQVEKLTKPLVLNPFYGYKDEDRNILNPFMDETVKEFSTIDGAFVIQGDGVVVSAGSLIQATDSEHLLPSGLGSRHAAAAAISLATQCIAVVVSASTGQVTLFRRGVMLPLTEKKVITEG
ncbi:diadenylate cyclase [Synoicihabitans lomoniglobus]|uniref:Diadenylate cyclase n=1 Tax=Synoicihabitans lomoniglobus TaxID=2909285 RepID=A0AAE9ZZK7_9BACT|nr:diadenylate cyclase [Opitutaceae bacterium LMO-M01]WED63502.1 diadenylate cyclase [Opitutaceae bacterium LMO-M01]